MAARAAGPCSRSRAPGGPARRLRARMQPPRRPRPGPARCRRLHRARASDAAGHADGGALARGAEQGDAEPQPLSEHHAAWFSVRPKSIPGARVKGSRGRPRGRTFRLACVVVAVIVEPPTASSVCLTDMLGGSMPKSWRRPRGSGVHPSFSLPAESPATIWRWAMTVSSSTGSVTSERRGGQRPPGDLLEGQHVVDGGRQRARRLAAQHHREDEVVPREDEGQDRRRPRCRAAPAGRRCSGSSARAARRRPARRPPARPECSRNSRS